jgi:hypothetical protein
MIHARPDYTERIQDTAGLIPDDEPVLLIRGQDRAAVPCIDMLTTMGRHLDLIRDWQERYGSKVAAGAVRQQGGGPPSVTDTSIATGFELRNPTALKVHQPCVKVDAGGDPNEDGPWARRWRCSTHDLPWTSSGGCEVASRRARAEMAEKREELAHERRKRAEASRAGLLALVEPGVSIYSTTRQTGTLGLQLGGVVVAVEDSEDRETGERERRFHVLDPHTKPIAHHVIAEWDVNRQAIEATPPSTLARLFRRLAWEMWDAGKPRSDGTIGRTSIDSRDADRVRWLTVLARQLLGGV